MTKVLAGVAVGLLGSAACLGQSSVPSTPMTIDGYTGQVPVVQVNGHPYVDLEALARVTNSSIRLQGNHLILTLPGQVPASNTASTPRTQSSADHHGFSREYVTANVTALNALRDWRASLLYAVRNNQPVTSDLTSPYQRTADSQVALATAAAMTSADKNAATLLQNVLSSMRTVNATLVGAHDSATNIRTDAMDTDPTSQKVAACLSALAGVTVGGQFQDVPSCH